LTISSDWYLKSE
jgi:hypothetical protein